MKLASVPTPDRCRPPPVDDPDRRLLRAADDRPRRHDRERRPAVDPARPRLQPGGPDLGRQRLPGHLREPAAPSGPARRPRRAQARLPRRARHVHVRVAPVRARPESGGDDRRPRAPGRRCRRPGLRDPGDHRHRVPRGRRASPRDERVRVRLGRRRLARPARRRTAHRGAELALGLPRQPPDRRGHVRARSRADPLRQGARPRARRRLARLAARHRVAHERDLRDRRGDRHGWASPQCSGWAASPSC